MYSDDTIYALATAPGRAGVAVIRISGARASGIRVLMDGALPPPRHASLRRLVDPVDHTQIDEALVLYMPAPNSFTGEDCIELHIHGSRAVVAALYRVLSTLEGFRLAQAGEFTRRAMQHGKLDLAQVEGLADLIDAETSSQHKQALRQMRGRLGEAATAIRQQMVEARALIEAWLDFPDEDIPEDTTQEWVHLVQTVRQQIATVLADAHHGERIRSGFQITIVGIPNAGKSTLLNALARRDVAIVSDEAGTTRDVLEVHLDIDGYAVVLADTAGIRETSQTVERIGIARARARAEDADLRLVLIDASVALSQQQEILDMVMPDDVVAVNKIDLNPQYLVEHAALLSPVALSLKEEDGINHLISALSLRISERFNAHHEPLITRERHRQAFEQAAQALDASLAVEAWELRAEWLRVAADAVGSITGVIHLEEVLDVLFRQFCIGK